VNRRELCDWAVNKIQGVCGGKKPEWETKLVYKKGRCGGRPLKVTRGKGCQRYLDPPEGAQFVRGINNTLGRSVLKTGGGGVKKTKTYYRERPTGRAYRKKKRFRRRKNFTKKLKKKKK